MKLAIGAGKGGGVSGTIAWRSESFEEDAPALRGPLDTNFSRAPRARAVAVRELPFVVVGFRAEPLRLGRLIALPPDLRTTFRSGRAFAIWPYATVCRPSLSTARPTSLRPLP